MTTDEIEKLLPSMIERYGEVLSDLETVRDAQWQVNSQIEKLTKVVFGLLEQLSEVKAKLELQQKAIEGDWPKGWPPLPRKDPPSAIRLPSR